MQCSAGDALSFCSEKQRSLGGEAAQSVSAGGSPARLGESGCASLQILLKRVEKLCTAGYSAVLIALASHMRHTTVVSATDVADIRPDVLAGPYTRQQSGEDDRAVALGPVVGRVEPSSLSMAALRL